MLVMSVFTLAGILSVIAIGQAQAIMAKMQNRQGVWRDRHRMSRILREDIHQATHLSLRDPQFIEIHIGDTLVNYAVEEGELVRKTASRIERFSLGTPAHWEIEQDHQVWLKGVDFEVVAVAPTREPSRLSMGLTKKSRRGIATLVMLVTLTVIMSICLLTGQGYVQRLRQFRNEEYLAQASQICDGLARRIQGMSAEEVGQAVVEWDMTPLESLPQSAKGVERWKGTLARNGDQWEVTATIQRGDTILAKMVRMVRVHREKKERVE
jgi:hypothetical protein